MSIKIEDQVEKLLNDFNELKQENENLKEKINKLENIKLPLLYYLNLQNGKNEKYTENIYIDTLDFRNFYSDTEKYLIECTLIEYSEYIHNFVNLKTLIMYDWQMNRYKYNHIINTCYFPLENHLITKLIIHNTKDWNNMIENGANLFNKILSFGEKCKNLTDIEIIDNNFLEKSYFENNIKLNKPILQLKKIDQPIIKINDNEYIYNVDRNRIIKIYYNNKI
jgi:hypothetical protein